MKNATLSLLALLLYACATAGPGPTERVYCHPPYSSGLVVCETYRR